MPNSVRGRRTGASRVGILSAGSFEGTLVAVSKLHFQPTRWTLVARSRESGQEGERALGELCQAYWFPLLGWARRSGASAADAEDEVQGFFAQVIEKDLILRADCESGKLRTFLLTAFRRYRRDLDRSSRCEKRGGGRVVSFDAAEAESWYLNEVRDDESADHFYDRQWALTLVERSLAALEEEALAKGRQRQFELLRPFLTTVPADGAYEEVGLKLEKSANAIKTAVMRMRQSFREALRKEVADLQGPEVDVDGEISYLLAVLRAV